MDSFYLNPYTVRAQCNAIKVRLEEDNRNYRIVMANVIKFINDTRLKSASYDALKQQMNDYLQIIQYLINANNCDIADCNSLSNSVGYEVLDGDQIYSMKNYYSRAIQECQAKSDYYNSCVIYTINSENPEISSYYLMMKWYYDSLVWTNSQLYNIWQKKEDTYYIIENATSGLFTYSAIYKDVARLGIQDMGSSFVNGNYVHNMAVTWRSHTLETYTIEMDEDDELYSFVNTWIDRAKLADKVTLAFNENDVKSAHKMLSDGYYFWLDKIGKRKYELSLTSPKGKTWADVRKYMDEAFFSENSIQNKKTNISWDKYDVKKISQDGVIIGSKNADSHFKNLADGIGKNIKFDEWYTGVSKNGLLKNSLYKYGDEFIENINIFNCFDKWKMNSNGMKFLKGAGFVGDVCGIVNNGIESYQENDGFSADMIQDTVTDSAIDIGTGAAAAATGAAIGSCFAPPIGTVVGAGAGILIDLAINTELDLDGDGDKHSAVDLLKDGVDNLCDKAGDAIAEWIW